MFYAVSICHTKPGYNSSIGGFDVLWSSICSAIVALLVRNEHMDQKDNLPILQSKQCKDIDSLICSYQHAGLQHTYLRSFDHNKK